MLKKGSLFFAVLAFSSVLSAQRMTAPANVAGPADARTQQQTPDAPDTTACSFVYSSGAGEFFTRYCLTVNGNIVQLDSPAAFEFINAGVISEGYGICDLTGGGAYFDYANNASGNWGATTVSAPNATTRKFVRTTTDGIWTLTQTIKQVKANASGTGSVKVTMALKNLTGIARDIFLVRFADVDANTDELDDEFSQTKQSAFGAEPILHGLLLTNNTAISDHYAAVWSTFVGPDPCNFNVNRNAAPFVGDGSIGHLWHFTVPSGSTKSMSATYRPF